jgi:hypothetical protein
MYHSRATFWHDTSATDFCGYFYETPYHKGGRGGEWQVISSFSKSYTLEDHMYIHGSGGHRVTNNQLLFVFKVINLYKSSSFTLVNTFSFVTKQI